MDSRSHPGAIVIQELERLAIEGSPQFERSLVVDESKGRYALFSMGWQEYDRIHTCLVHVEIIDDKVWIQEDALEEGFAVRLLAAGISKSQLVLGFYAPEERVLTDFAVA